MQWYQAVLKLYIVQIHPAAAKKREETLANMSLSDFWCNFSSQMASILESEFAISSFKASENFNTDIGCLGQQASNSSYLDFDVRLTSP